MIEGYLYSQGLGDIEKDCFCDNLEVVVKGGILGHLRIFSELTKGSGRGQVV